MNSKSEKIAPNDTQDTVSTKSRTNSEYDTNSSNNEDSDSTSKKSCEIIENTDSTTKQKMYLKLLLKR